MTEIKNTWKLSCNHNYEYIFDTNVDTDYPQLMCSKCQCVKKFNSDLGNIYTLTNAPLDEVTGLEKRHFSRRTNLTKHRIVLRKKTVKTRYYAQKMAVEIALLLFADNPGWNDIFIEVPFEGGLVQTKLDKSEFNKYFNRDVILKPSHSAGALYSKKDILLFASAYTILRISRYIPPGSKYETFWARITKNKYFL